MADEDAARHLLAFVQDSGVTELDRMPVPVLAMRRRGHFAREYNNALMTMWGGVGNVRFHEIQGHGGSLLAADCHRSGEIQVICESNHPGRLPANAGFRFLPPLTMPRAARPSSATIGEPDVPGAYDVAVVLVINK